MPADGSQNVAHRVSIRIADVSIAAGATDILRSVSLVTDTPGPTALLGPNGSGKTTLLRLMMGLEAAASGHLALCRSGGEVRRALVFQKPVMLRRTAAANVAFALAAAGRPTTAGLVDDLLRRVGLAAVAARPARRLSGGEQQRLALARALALEPDVLLLDEPTASLDPAQAKAVELIIRSVAEAGVKIVIATHDLGQARRLADDVVLLVAGRVVEHASTAAFFTSPADPRTRRFLAGELVY